MLKNPAFLALLSVTSILFSAGSYMLGMGNFIFAFALGSIGVYLFKKLMEKVTPPIQ